MDGKFIECCITVKNFRKFHTCPIPLQDVQWTFECPLDISVRPLDEWTSECPLDISVCPMDEWTFECRMDISVRPLVEWTYECPMDISVHPMVEWTFVYVQWTLLIFNTKYDNAGNAFCLLKAIMNSALTTNFHILVSRGGGWFGISRTIKF